MTSQRTPLFRAVLLALALSGVARGAEDDWFKQLINATEPAVRAKLLDQFKGRYNYATVRGLCRGAAMIGDPAAALDGVSLAADMAERLNDDRARAFVGLYRGGVYVAQGEVARAVPEYELAAKLWLQEKWPDAAHQAEAWRAWCAAKLGDPAGAATWLARSKPLNERLYPAVEAARGNLDVLYGWAGYTRAWFEDEWQRWQPAEVWYRAAADHFRTAGATRLLAAALDRAGLMCYYQSKPEARELYRQSLAAAEAAGDSFAVGRAHLGFAEIENDLAHYDLVLQELDRALGPFTKAASDTDLARVYWLRATVRQNQGDHALVEAELQQAERHYHAIESLGGLADCNLTRGANWLYLGDRARAVAALQQALTSYHQTSNFLGEANVKLKLSHTYRLVGLDEQARKLAGEALQAYELVGDQPGRANTLRAMAALAKRAGDLDQAQQQFEQALAIYRQTKDALGQAAALQELGSLRLERGQEADGAVKLLLDSMDLYKSVGDRHGAAMPALTLGRYVARRGDAKLAFQAFSAALQWGESCGSRSIVAAALYQLGQLQEALAPPRLEQAVEMYRLALEVVEQMRERAGEKEAQQGLQQGYLEYYEALIRALVKLHQDGAAFAVAESAHARTLLDLVVDAGVNLNAGLAIGQRAQEETKAWRLTQANVALGRLLAAPEGQDDAIVKAREELLAARDDLQQFRTALYLARPDLGVRRAAATCSATDLGQVLPTDTAVVEYLLGQRASYVFVVAGGNRPQVTALELPLTATAVNERATEFRTACANPRRRPATAGRALAEAVLDPVLAKLPATTQRLVIVADQGLGEVPFQALPVGDKDYLWDRYELDYANSASLLRQARAAAPVKSTGLLAFANPKFGPLVRSPELERGEPLAELPGTADEAAALAKEFPAAVVLQREQATEEEAKRRMAGFRYLHFATHGILDSANPLYSAVILTEPAAGSREDGQLEARELLDLHLDADLVTLSACETGRGKVQPGEGLLGLSWALTAAGARSEVVSLWQVSDEATGELMAGFYHRLQAGEGKAAALRSAALDLRRRREHPYFWAPFVMIGSW